MSGSMVISSPSLTLLAIFSATRIGIALLIAFLSYIDPKDSAIKAEIPMDLKQSTACCLELPAPKFLDVITISSGFAFFEMLPVVRGLFETYFDLLSISTS